VGVGQRHPAQSLSGSDTSLAVGRSRRCEASTVSVTLLRLDPGDLPPEVLTIIKAAAPTWSAQVWQTRASRPGSMFELATMRPLEGGPHAQCRRAPFLP
jgi:hypothetical protein